MLLPTRFTIHASRITSSLTLFIEPEVHEVVVLHHILFEFQALLAGALCLGLASGFDKVREAGYLRADEAFLDVRMDGARRFPGGRPLANRPGAVFLAADGQERDVASIRKGVQEQRVGGLDRKST